MKINAIIRAIVGNKECPAIVFGTGAFGLSCLCQKFENETIGLLIIDQLGGEYKIGEELPTEIVNPLVGLQFSKTESIDVMIDTLGVLKDRMIKEKTKL